MPAAFSSMTKELPAAVLLQRSVEDLNNHLKLGTLLEGTVSVECNRIANSLLSILQAPPNGTNVLAMLKVMDDYFGVSRKRSDQGGIMGDQQWLKHKKEYLRRQMNESARMDIFDLIPVPAEALLPLVDLPMLIAKNEMVLVVSHLFAHCNGTKYEEEAKRLSEKMKFLIRAECLHLVPDEEIITKKNQLAQISFDLINELRTVTNNRNGFAWLWGLFSG